MNHKPSHAIRLLLAVLCLAAVLWNPARSLFSFRKINDFPLYSMHLYGNDGFARYLQEKTRAVQTSSAQQPAPVWACTVFTALDDNGQPLLARNFDWRQSPALILFSHPSHGYDSVSMVDISYLGFDGEDPAFLERIRLNDAALIPFDGMNEAGLSVGMNAISHAEARLNTDHPTIDSLVVIRLLLDQAASVEEAIALLKETNIDFGSGPPIHYLIADSSGASVIIEYIDNQMRILKPENPRWQVSTNFLLSENPSGQWPQICSRYRRAAETLAENDGRLDSISAMSLLEDTSQSSTRWSILYHMESGNIDLVTGRDYENVLHFELR